jgi:hypothetical protein
MASPLESGLPEDAVQRPGRHIIPRLAGHCHSTQLDGLAELTVAANARDLDPAIASQQVQDIAELLRHGRIRAIASYPR